MYVTNYAIKVVSAQGPGTLRQSSFIMEGRYSLKDGYTVEIFYFIYLFYFYFINFAL